MQNSDNHRRKQLILVGKIVISVSLLTLLISKVDLLKVFKAVQTYSLTTIILVLAITIFSGFWAALKWNLLLGDFAFLKILEISFIRYFYALVLAGQVTGDIARVYKMGKAHQGNMPLFAASVFIDRVTGFLSLFFVSLFGVLFSRVHLPMMLIGLLLAISIVGLLALFLMRFEWYYQPILRLLAFLCQRLRIPARFCRHISPLTEALHLYSNKTLLLSLSILCGVVFQVLCITATALLADELGIKVAFIDWCWVFGVVTVLLFLPVSISGIGIREGSFVGLLGALGVAHEKALALSFSVFGLEVFLGILGGIIEFNGNIRS